MTMKIVYIRAEIIRELPSGQKYIKLLANNADGIRFYTDDKSIIYPENIPKRVIDEKYFDE